MSEPITFRIQEGVMLVNDEYTYEPDEWYPVTDAEGRDLGMASLRDDGNVIEYVLERPDRVTGKRVGRVRPWSFRP